MRAFKKRTIALVLASVVTVVGAFASENYKNSIMGLTFTAGSSGVRMLVQTRSVYEGDITPIRKGANTYVLMMPETTSQDIKPRLANAAGRITSVDVQTIPYSSSSRGYTKITVKTAPDVSLVVRNQVYVPSNNYDYLQTQNSHEDKEAQLEQEQQLARERAERERQAIELAEKAKQEALQREQAAEKAKQYEILRKQNEAREMARKAQAKLPAEQNLIESRNIPQQEVLNEETPNISQNDDITEQFEDVNDSYNLILGIIILLALIAFFIVRARDKMTELAGEKIDISIDDEKPNKDAKSNKKDKKKVAPKAKKQKKASVVSEPVMSRNEYTVSNSDVIQEPQVIETVNVVDLDEIFKEQSKDSTSAIIDEEAENAALEDFLSGFSFDEEFFNAEQEEDAGYDVEFYDRIIAEGNCKFSKDDVEKINKLLNTEINDSTLKNIEKYAVSNPIKKKPSKKQLLEEFVTTYSIEQNVIFSKEDVGALYKLISVEIDSDFITDLRTDPKRMKEMQEELLSKKERVRKSSEILTLNVKDMLPDLSEALRKQGGRAIQSEVKPQTVYFSEGYDVSKLTLKDELPDLATEISNKEAYVSKPSAEYDLVDNSYDVKKLKISSQLPDLTDMLKNPGKYASPDPEVVEVDPEALLNSITDVQFKPFYDGEQIEIINDASDFEDTTVEEIQKEMNQFGNLEIAQEETFDTGYPENDNDDFEALYSNEYFDLDSETKTKTSTEPKVENEETQLTNLPEIEQEQNEDSVLDEIAISEPEKTSEPVKQESLVVEVQPEVDSKIVSESVSIQKQEAKNNSAEELLKRIQSTRERRVERALPQRTYSRPITTQKNGVDSSKVIADIKCIFKGETYTVVSSAHFIGRAGCYLAKNEKGYVILGHYGDKLVSLRQYETLKSEKVQSRMSEKLSDDTYRFLVRIGINKFVVDVNGEEIKYVMDLC